MYRIGFSNSWVDAMPGVVARRVRIEWLYRQAFASNAGRAAAFEPDGRGRQGCYRADKSCPAYDGGVVDQRLPLRVPGIRRGLVLLALLFGVAAMHPGVVAVPHMADRGHPVVMSEHAGEHGVFAPVSVNHDSAVAHAAAHACVFILSTFAFIVGLVLLYRAGIDSGNGQMPTYHRWRAHRGRPPPWTAPSLSQLSILRV